ncbi:MAG: UDP-N-acetylmuramate dehydrogenase [Gammaproteobacteria bacterium]|nr:UDP-N-acetylmuramate dehydrogenase [Gammaproteobacteria bacterium]
MTFEKQKNLKDYNTFGLESVAQHYFVIEQVSDLNELHAHMNDYEQYWVLGGGSNVILSSEVSGLTIHQRCQGIRILKNTQEATYVQAMAGEVWHDFVAFCLDNGCYGIENLAFIPGTVGAAPVQNVGAYGVEVSEFIEEVQAFDPKNGVMITLTAKDCEFAYRDSIFKKEAKDLIIMSVVFRFPNTWQAKIDYPDVIKYFEGVSQDQITPKDVFDAIVAIRRFKLPDPKVQGSAGSFFKNPIVSAEQCEQLKKQYPNIPVYLQASGDYKIAAGWLIDQAGFKGHVWNEVCVHQRQALVLVNVRGKASVDEVYEVADVIKTKILHQFGVALEEEPLFF